MNEKEMVELAMQSPWEAYEAWRAYEGENIEKDPNGCGRACEAVMKAIGRKSLDAVVDIANEHNDQRLILFNADALIADNPMIAYEEITNLLSNQDEFVRKATEAFAAKHPNTAYETALQNDDKYLLSCAEEALGKDGVTGK